MKEKLLRDFAVQYDNNKDVALFFAPGRVNLIGEHIDYNGGYVLPCALKNGTYIAARLRSDRQINLYSANFTEVGICHFELAERYCKTGQWTDYAIGTLQVLQNEGYHFDCGFDLYCYGNIPNGAGLSSSSSLEVAVLTFLNHCYNFAIDKVTIAKLARRVENDFIGVNSGIMDQFIIAMGQADKALLLNTDTLAFDYIPLNLGDYRLVIGNTNKKRTLADSKYNERFAQCQTALAALSKNFGIAALCQLKAEQLEVALAAIEDDVVKRRLRHVVTEQYRTIDAAEALRRDDLIEFGKLMNASHASLKEDYAVSGRELDTLVELAQKRSDVIGARMTGAGFGGCMIALVQKDGVADYIAELTEKYTEIIGYAPTFYDVAIGDGGGRIPHVISTD